MAEYVVSFTDRNLMMRVEVKQFTRVYSYRKSRKFHHSRITENEGNYRNFEDDVRSVIIK